MRFPPIVRFRRICWFSKCSLQYSQTVCELTEAGIAFNKAVFWQCIKQKEIGVVVEVASTTNGELMALGRISSAFHVSEEWEKFGPVEIGKRADILFTPTQSFQFVLFHLAHQFTQSKAYRNLNRRPAYHNRSGVPLMPPLQQTLIRIFCIKKLERHSETSVLIYWGRNLLFGFVQEMLYTPITSQPYFQLYRPVPICVSNLKLESRNSKCKNCSNRSAIKPSFIQQATNLLQCKTFPVHSLNATEIIIILNESCVLVEVDSLISPEESG